MKPEVPFVSVSGVVRPSPVSTMDTIPFIKFIEGSALPICRSASSIAAANTGNSNPKMVFKSCVPSSFHNEGHSRCQLVFCSYA